MSRITMSGSTAEPDLHNSYAQLVGFNCGTRPTTTIKAKGVFCPNSRRSACVFQADNQMERGEVVIVMSRITMSGSTVEPDLHNSYAQLVRFNCGTRPTTPAQLVGFNCGTRPTTPARFVGFNCGTRPTQLLCPACRVQLRNPTYTTDLHNSYARFVRFNCGT